MTKNGKFVVPGWLADIHTEKERERKKEKERLRRIEQKGCEIAKISAEYDLMVRRLLTGVGAVVWGPDNFWIQNTRGHGATPNPNGWEVNHHPSDWDKERYVVWLHFNENMEPTHFGAWGEKEFTTETERDPLSETALQSALHRVCGVDPDRWSAQSDPD